MKARVPPSNKPLVLGLGVVGIVVAMILAHQARAPLALHGTETTAHTGSDTTRQIADTTIPVDPLARVFYLLDISGSTHSAGVDDPLRQAAQLVEPAVAAVSSLDEVLPQEHIVGTIGATSLRQQPVCRIPIRRQQLFEATDTSWYKGKVDACVHQVEDLPADPYTDIRGALDYAAQSIGGARPAMRMIVLFTDLSEDLAPGQVAATPQLHGICVAVYTVVTDSLARRPDELRSREEQWTRDLRAWGAKGIGMWTTIGFDPTELRSFVRSCEHR